MIRIRDNLPGLSVLLVGLCVTLLTWHLVREALTTRDKADFDRDAVRVRDYVEGQLRVTENLLTQAEAFFSASREVTPDEFRLWSAAQATRGVRGPAVDLRWLPAPSNGGLAMYQSLAYSPENTMLSPAHDATNVEGTEASAGPPGSADSPDLVQLSRAVYRQGVPMGTLLLTVESAGLLPQASIDLNGLQVQAAPVRGSAAPATRQAISEREGVRTLTSAFLLGDEPWMLEVSRESASGSAWIANTVLALGVLTSFLAFVAVSLFRDRKEDERRRQRQEQSTRIEAAEAVSLRETFLALASHELKTPLAALRLQLDVLERSLHRQAQSPEKIDRLMHLGRRQVDRLNGIVDSLLDVSRLNEKHTLVAPRVVDLGELAAGVLLRFQDQLGAAGQEVRLKKERSIYVSGDAVRLEEALVHLLTNAMKFGRGKPVTVKAWCDAECGFLEVRDRGVGIAANELEHVFERFERCGRSTDHGGLGLGLYVTAEIARAHNGSIHVDSTPGEGSAFRLSLPLHSGASDDPGEEKELDIATAATLQKERI